MTSAYLSSQYQTSKLLQHRHQQLASAFALADLTISQSLSFSLHSIS